MLNFCPNCGTELKSAFRFCPNCGVNLQENENKEFSANQTYKVIICDNCGEENSTENTTCAGCGVKLEGKVIEKSGLQSVKERKSEKELRRVKPEIKKSSAKPFPEKKVEPSLDTKKILLIFGGLFLIVFIILLASGVFDAVKVPETATNINPGINDQSQGADLSNLNLINQLEEKVKNNPDDHESLLQLAHLLNDSKFYDRAITRYKEYLDEKPEDADARIDMGVCYYNLQQYDQSIESMTKALEYQPNHQIGHLNLGIVNLSAGNLEESRKWLNSAVQLNPNSDIGKKAEELLKNH